VIDEKSAQSVTRWLGDTIGFWVQTFAFIISAVAAILIIIYSKRQESRRATIDLVLHQTSDQEFKDTRKKIKKMHESKDQNFSKYLDQPDSEEYRLIMFMLNSYEFVAGGVREGAFDENSLKRMRYSTTLTDWRAFHSFIHEFNRRRDSETFFQDFEWLCKRWEDNPLVVDKRKKKKPFIDIFG
jgi:hypothetical protein